MRFTSVLTLALATVATASPYTAPLIKKATGSTTKSGSAKPPGFFLAGDSTTAAPSDNGGGWGPGFLSTLTNGADGTNFGHNGATTASFREGGDWTKVLWAIGNATASWQPICFIGFGHNDGKDSKNITIKKFQHNYMAFIWEVIHAGGTPVLLTPLSRRTFDDGKPRKVVETISNLSNYSNAVIEVSKLTKTTLLDLNKNSTTYLNAIGPEHASYYNLKKSDETHLNYGGSLVFGNMMAGLFKQSPLGRKLDSYIKPDEAILEAIKQGKFYFPPTSKSS